MEEGNVTKKKGMPPFTKISIVINTLLFGITGVIYLTEGNKIIGYVLLAAGAINIMYSLITVKTKNYLFVVLNFLFALVALVVSLDLYFKNSDIGIVWMVIAIIYLVVGFVLLMQVRDRKKNQQP
jgi:hypothetical protein